MCNLSPSRIPVDRNDASHKLMVLSNSHLNISHPLDSVECIQFLDPIWLRTELGALYRTHPVCPEDVSLDALNFISLIEGFSLSGIVANIVDRKAIIIIITIGVIKHRELESCPE